MEAEMACQFLAPCAQPHGEVGVQKLPVSGCLLTVLVLKRAKCRVVAGGYRRVILIVK